MTNEQAIVAPLASMVGFGVARLVLGLRMRRPPSALMRTNVDGRPVPAVLAEPLLVAGVLVAGAVALAGVFEPQLRFPRMTLAVAVVVVVLGTAGRWDDLRGDERPRGFKGHLGAARSGAVTGGLVKMIAGGLAGVVAGLLIGSGWTVLETAVLVAMSANLVNLLDRAPGRAGKVTVVAAVLLAILGSTAWTLTVAGFVGALIACLPADLDARAMLGDAAANPLGGLVGLGLAASMARPGRLAAIGVLVLLNALSEKYSFSQAIERVGVLRALDQWGRPRKPRN